MVKSLIDLTLEEIAKNYHPGALVWIKLNRPDEWGKMLTLERGINKMAFGGDTEGLRKTLSEYQELILAMLKEFRAPKERNKEHLTLWSLPSHAVRVRGG